MSFLIELARKDKRLDGRQLLEPRPFQVDRINGLYQLRAKDTHITLNHHISLEKPYSDKPHLGIFNISVIDPVRERNGLYDRQTSNFLKLIFLRTKVIDSEALCLIYNELCFSISLSFIILESDGDCRKYCSLLLIEALKHIDLFDEAIKTEKTTQSLLEVLNDGDIFHNKKIIFNFIPSIYILALAAGKIIHDPTAAELKVADSLFVAVLNKKNLIMLEKTGVECDFEDIDRIRNFCVYNECK